jgi:predicted glycogen debranching enzyme
MPASTSSTPPTIIGYRRGETPDSVLLQREWLVANGIGGYASGTIARVITRRFHGLLIAALRNPLGRTMMLNKLTELVDLPDGRQLALAGPGALVEFRLELGLPVWIYDFEGVRLERRLFLPAKQNTVAVVYSLIEAPGPIGLHLRPAVHFRPHEGAVGTEPPAYTVAITEDRFELRDAGYPPLRLHVRGAPASFAIEPSARNAVEYPVEAARGYDSRGVLWSRGRFDITLEPHRKATLIASIEDWEIFRGLADDELYACEVERRRGLLGRVPTSGRDAVVDTLLLGADQFVIAPVGRVVDAARARARGDSLRTVIAGYHWFTDWGRDTMISLEGLCLLPRRFREARGILRTFAGYVRDGLIPNLFPEGAEEGRYNTADATLWFFHALDRYLAYTGDHTFVRALLPLCEEIIQRHVAGTRFGIAVDGNDQLLSQGEDGYALTWMDAKCDDWVVTPRRGKTVEINALWYNALVTMAGWLRAFERGGDAEAYEERAQRVRESFNARFWFEDGGYLYDVVDGPDKKVDPLLRPNQLIAISLPHPVLDRARWRPVLDAVGRALLTPVGLRSLAPGSPGYQRNYHGDLRTRDAAYHQGTVWSWLIGPYVDALLRAEPDARAAARTALAGLTDHSMKGCLGQVAEIFDAEAPFEPRGCIAQAWGTAEWLRALDRASEAPRAPALPPTREETRSA